MLTPCNVCHRRHYQGSAAQLQCQNDTSRSETSTPSVSVKPSLAIASDAKPKWVSELEAIPEYSDTGVFRNTTMNDLEILPYEHTQEYDEMLSWGDGTGRKFHTFLQGDEKGRLHAETWSISANNYTDPRDNTYKAQLVSSMKPHDSLDDVFSEHRLI